MPENETKQTAIVGVAEHGNSAELVTVTADGRLLDRRRIDLTKGLPTHPYHHEGAWAMGRYTDSPWAREITLPEAVKLVEEVRHAAGHGARQALAELSQEVSARITGIAIRCCPPLPPTIEERIADNRAQTLADSVMYRKALARAARKRGERYCGHQRAALYLSIMGD